MASFVDSIWSNIRNFIPNLNTSVTSITGRIVEVCGTFMDMVRLELLRSEQVIAQGARKARITTAEFYIDVAYAYQEGDNLIITDPASGRKGYAETDPLKQIIKQATISDTGLGAFTINVATVDSDNNIVQLTQEQLDAFSAYFLNFLGIGAQVSIASNEPAVFTADNLYIRYNRTYNLDNIKQTVYDGLHAIQLQQRSVNRIFVNEVETYLINLPGIDDAYLANPSITYREDEEFPVDGTFTLTPGYFNFDPALYDFDQDKTIFQVSDAV